MKNIKLFILERLKISKNEGINDKGIILDNYFDNNDIIIDDIESKDIEHYFWENEILTANYDFPSFLNKDLKKQNIQHMIVIEAHIRHYGEIDTNALIIIDNFNNRKDYCQVNNLTMIGGKKYDTYNEYHSEWIKYKDESGKYLYLLKLEHDYEGSQQFIIFESGFRLKEI